MCKIAFNLVLIRRKFIERLLIIWKGVAENMKSAEPNDVQLCFGYEARLRTRPCIDGMRFIKL